MMKIPKLTQKLILSYLVIAFLMIGLGSYSIFTLKQVNQNGEEIYQTRLIPISKLGQISKYAENTRVQMLQSVNAKDPSFTKVAQENMKEIQALIDSYDSSIMTPEAKTLWNEFTSSWDQFTNRVEINIQLVKQGNYEEAADGLKKGREPFTKASEALMKLMQVNEQLANQLIGQSKAHYAISETILIGAIVLVTILAIAIGWITGRVISRPVLHISSQAASIAQGNLAVEPITVNNKDELRGLAESFNHMVVQLRDLVGTVRSSAEELSAASEELAASSEQVCNSVEEISSNTLNVAKEAESGNQEVVEASKVLLELSSLIQIAKQKATTALTSSQITIDTANQGKEIVDDTIERMSQIQERTIQAKEQIETLHCYTKEIESITQMITNIAAQTNLLALNASIEAARAGEHGKGFAVVANEVRNLAEQSNMGASKVSELIRKISISMQEVVTSTQENRLEVEQGTAIVSQAGVALENILHAVENTRKEVNGIKEITTEEVATSDKIVTLIHSLANMIENTASSAEQVSSAVVETSASMQTVSSSAEETSSMATSLKNAVDVFKL